MASKVRPRALETSPIATMSNGGGEDVRVSSWAVRAVTVVCSANIVGFFAGNVKDVSGAICIAVAEESGPNRGAGTEIGRGTVAEICCVGALVWGATRILDMTECEGTEVVGRTFCDSWALVEGARMVADAVA